MFTPLLQVLDMEKRGDGSFACKSERCGIVGEVTPCIKVSWNATRCPPGWESVGQGVAFVAPDPALAIERQTESPDPKGPNGFLYRDTAHPQGMLLILILPVGHLPRGEDSFSPEPVLVKRFKGRLAILWQLERDENEITWTLEQTAGGDAALRETVQRVNDHVRRSVSLPNVEIVDDDDTDPVPTSPAQWLLLSARKVPAMWYAVAVVGLAAAAALSLGFFWNNWLLALFAGIVTLAAMALLRVYASTTFEALSLNVTLPAQVFIWTSVVAYSCCLLLGVGRLAVFLYASTTPQQPPGDPSKVSTPSAKVQKEPEPPQRTEEKPKSSKVIVQNEPEPQKATPKKQPEPPKPEPPKNPLEGLVLLGHTSDRCRQGGPIVFRGINGDVPLARGQRDVPVPVSPTAQKLVWHCAGSKDDDSDMPTGTSVVMVSWPQEGGGAVFYEDFWGKR